MSATHLTADQINRVVSPLMAGQRQVAAELTYEAETTGDHDLELEAAYERGQVNGMEELAKLIGVAFLRGVEEATR